MPSQSAAKSSKEKEAANKDAAAVPVNSAKDQVHSRVKDRIAGRAYNLYQEGGDQHGQHLEHWLRAESEILPAIPEIRESSSWFTVNVPLKGFDASEVQVSVEPEYAIVTAEKQESSVSEPGRASDIFQQTVYTRASWPNAVDPETASAYLKNDVLTLTVKRANSESANADGSTDRSV